MKHVTKAILLLASLSLAACSSNPFGQADGGLGGDGGLDANANAGINSSTLDPTSPAYFAQTVGDRVLFAVDQSTLTEQGRVTLAGQARWLTDNPSYTAIIEGHADEQGTREYNLALGARRAAAARDFLVSQGVADGRLRTVSFGKERPLEICSEEACYAQNRRAVTVIAAGLSS